ncbi:hypothetical protein PhaeoP24_01206 [Phaeobacter inhibens]|uniref:hypothetical protein n=1 Tax=Phaeobacter inhibens TaxID=221822 RepID=UPI000C9BC874|nr:hypothetical protein [Phaeobacter inhibens]AUQ89834.1 hypothetical protein PhaeoP24_01206 [Phaeobacter inhibens]
MTDLIKTADALAEEMRLIEEEAKRTIEWGEEDPIRMLYWFDTQWINALTTYRQARESADGVKVKPLVWSDPQPPRAGRPSYDHVISETIFGPIIIEWKSWKDHDEPGAQLPWGEYVCGKDLETAKAEVFTRYEARIKAALED